MATSTLIHATGTVMAAIDPSSSAASVADHAAWAAMRLESPLAFLHTLERTPTLTGSDLSGNLTLGAKSALLEELSALDEQRARLAQARGRELLAQARDRVATATGVAASVQMRHGTLVETLLELEGDVRLFVLGKLGEHAGTAAHPLGSNLERVVRAVHRPVLVAPGRFSPIERFLVAYDGSATARKCVEMVCASPLLHGLHCTLLMAGADAPSAREHLDWAAGRLRGCGFAPDVQRIDGRPDAVIADAVAAGAQLVVMGAYGHSRIRQLIVGSTTTQVLRSCEVPVLLLR
jgi:nucleotide-binding universal stress UspA family protein